MLLLAAFGWCSSATAQPDPEPAPNIPEAHENRDFEPKVSRAQAEGALPLPYVRWHGTGLPPPSTPPRPELPPPHARPRSLPRRPVELSAAFITLLPSCGSGRIDDRGCRTVSPGPGVDLLLLYRAYPFFAVGGEAALGGFGGGRGGPWSNLGGGARFIGVAGRVYFAQDGAWDPYLALTLGAGSLTLKSDEALATGERTSGLGGRIAGGLDYLLGSHLRVGATASFTHWVAYREQRCGAYGCREEPLFYGRLLGFATLGLRVTASFGAVL